MEADDLVRLIIISITTSSKVTLEYEAIPLLPSSHPGWGSPLRVKKLIMTSVFNISPIVALFI